MPYYNFSCKKCNYTREYRVPKVGLIPSRCEGCDKPGTLVRNYSGEGFSIGGVAQESRQDSPSSDLGWKVLDHKIMPCSCGGFSGLFLLGKNKKSQD